MTLVIRLHECIQTLYECVYKCFLNTGFIESDTKLCSPVVDFLCFSCVSFSLIGVWINHRISP